MTKNLITSWGISWNLYHSEVNKLVTFTYTLKWLLFIMTFIATEGPRTLRVTAVMPAWWHGNQNWPSIIASQQTRITSTLQKMLHIYMAASSGYDADRLRECFPFTQSFPVCERISWFILASCDAFCWS